MNVPKVRSLLPFALAVLMTSICTLVATGWAQVNPVPFLSQPLVPASAAPGGSDFMLTVNGSGFVPGGVVNWNGIALATTWVSGRQLTANVPAASIAMAGTASLTVSNPGPGGGVSDVTFFPVTRPTNPVVFVEKDYALGYAPAGIVTADFNRDGKRDVAVTNPADDGWVDVLLGDGQGSFVATRIEGLYRPSRLAAQDFNGDGIPDIIVTVAVLDTPYLQLMIMLGNGDGTFQAPQAASGWQDSFWGIAIGDFKADGKLDVVLPVRSGESDSWLTIVLGNGDGTFQPMNQIPLSHPLPAGVLTNDFDGDGKLDLAVPNQDSDWMIGTAVEVLSGVGDGTFVQESLLHGPFDNFTGVTADFNGDGNADLAISNQLGGISVQLGNGDGTFRSQGKIGTASSPTPAAVGDFNGDGIVDMMVSTGTGTLYALLGKGDGTFDRRTSFPAVQLSGPIAGDFNGDGKLDLVAINGSQVTVLLQSSVTLSTASLTFPVTLVGSTSAVQTATVTNRGSVSLNIKNIKTSAGFLQKNNCGSSLAAGQSCRIEIAFQPTDSKNFSGTVSITDDASTSPQTITLSGTGTAVSLSPASLDFGDQSVGTTSGPRQITVTNVGLTAISISSIVLSGTDAEDFRDATTCVSTLGPKSSCEIGVKFKPSTIGARTATIVVSAGSGGDSQVVSLSGNGT